MNRYCHSCGAPLAAASAAQYCPYCVDGAGKLKPYAEVKAGVEQWLKSWAPESGTFDARAESYLRAMPAWAGR
jgi:hypothetical protein